VAEEKVVQAQTPQDAQKDTLAAAQVTGLAAGGSDDPADHGAGRRGALPSGDALRRPASTASLLWV